MGIHGAQEVNIEQAYIAGQWARETGRSIDSCPTYAMGEQGAPYRDEWRRGWKDTDEQIRRKA